MRHHYDVCILGAGILGVALAHKCNIRFPNLKICVIEPLDFCAQLQTKKNSGVVHSGVFYSDKYNILDFCLEGKYLLNEFCFNQNLSIKNTGKHIKIKDSILMDRCVKYGIKYELKDDDLFLSEVNLVNYKEITVRLYQLCSLNVHFFFNVKNIKFCEKSLNIKSSSVEDNLIINYTFLFNLTGTKANDIYQNFNKDHSYTTCEILGRYHEFKEYSESMYYNSPDFYLPFLGVHITPTFHNTTKIGPDAYPIIFSNYLNNNYIDIYRRIKFYINNKQYFDKNKLNVYPQYMLEQINELNLQNDFTQYLKQDIGTRSVLLDSKNKIEKNFIFKQTNNTIHFLNSGSPAATCSLSLANYMSNLIG